jgi:hypothetical protein
LIRRGNGGLVTAHRTHSISFAACGPGYGTTAEDIGLAFQENHPEAEMRTALIPVLFAAMLSPAWGFGFTAGPPIEEHFGSDYGAEYYYRNAERCRVVVVKGRHGHRVKVKRCDRHPER